MESLSTKPGIYCITFENGKSYVGLAKYSIDKRIKGHLSMWKKKNRKNNALYPAMDKYVFTVKVLENCELNQLCEREIFWIKELNTMSPNGYNLTSGGDYGWSPSQETIEKIRKSKKGLLPTEDHKEKVRLSTLAYYKDHPEESYKRTAQFKGVSKSEEHKAKISESLAKLDSSVTRERCLMGAAKVSKSIKVINLLTKEEMIFPSIAEASRQLNLSVRAILLRLEPVQDNLRFEYN